MKIEEISQNDFEKGLKEDRYIREKDLKGHLTSTIETAEEKNQRELAERKERAQRIKDMESKQSLVNKENKKEGMDDLFKSYEPSQDYQVLQAVRYLQGLKVFESSVKATN